MRLNECYAEMEIGKCVETPTRALRENRFRTVRIRVRARARKRERIAFIWCGPNLTHFLRGRPSGKRTRIPSLRHGLRPRARGLTTSTDSADIAGQGNARPENGRG